MCGIAGMIARRRAVARADVCAMINAVAHRGPDHEGIWIDEAAGIGMGHRRLAIVDLSPSGHQPMISRDERWIIAFNGEIYNHLDLRAQLADSFEWRGYSDTETLIECIAAWGLEATLQRAVGMFAITLWDRGKRQLHLVRDRFGEKPLYYGWAGGEFLWGSELKALMAHPRFDNVVSQRAQAIYARLTHVPAPLSIFEHIFKLLPGHVLTVDPAMIPSTMSSPPAAGEADGLRLSAYWNYPDVVRAGLDAPIASERDARDELEEVLAAAIKGQAVADVPVGAFLSGGVDSSAVVALYRRHTTGTVKTFTVGFAEAALNEADHARAVARHLGTDHHELYVTAEDAQAVIPLLPRIYDEPFGDSSQIPTFLVSRFARAQVTVALSGDGGDELFGGYNRHVEVPRLWAAAQRLPGPVRAVLGTTLGRVPGAVWTGASRILPGGTRRPQWGHKVAKGLSVMGGAHAIADVHHAFLDEWHGDSPMATDAAAPRMNVGLGPETPDAIVMMVVDALGYLPDDILVKVDRAGMAVSLEGRVPFLDHRVAELAARIPLAMKVRSGVGKHILREMLFQYAPPALFDRPKAGFAVPVGEWIRSSLRDWTEELLDNSRLDAAGFDAARVRRRWQRHLQGLEDATAAIWSVLMFQAWDADRRFSA